MATIENRQKICIMDANECHQLGARENTSVSGQTSKVPAYSGGVTAYLGIHGFIVPDRKLREILQHRYQEMINKLTVVYTPKVGPPQRVQMFSYNGAYIILPRTMLALIQKVLPVKIDLPTFGSDDTNSLTSMTPTNTTISPTTNTTPSTNGLPSSISPPVIPKELKINLFDNQKIIIDKLMNDVFNPKRIAAGTATGILNLRAGMGKSFVAAGLVARLGVPTLIVVPKKPLALQMRDDMVRCGLSAVVWSNSTKGGVRAAKMSSENSNIGSNKTATGKKKRGAAPSTDTNITNPAVTIGVINSVMKIQPATIRAKFGFVVFDEVHSYCTPGRRDIFRRATVGRVLGMSATTEDRADTFDIIATRALAVDGIIRAEEIPGFAYDNVAFDCKVDIIKYYGLPEHTQNLTHESTGRIFTHYMHGQFLGDPARLELAISELMTLYDWRDEAGNMHYIYVFAEELDLLRMAMTAMSDALAARGRNDIVASTTCVDDVAAVDTNETVDDINISPSDTLCDEISDNTNNTETDANKDIPTEIVSDDNKDNSKPVHKHLEMFTGGLSEQKIQEVTKNARVLFSTYGYAGTGISILKMSAILFLTPRKANMKQILARILRRGSDQSIPRVVVDIVDARTALVRQYSVRSEAYEFYGFKKNFRKVVVEEAIPDFS